MKFILLWVRLIINQLKTKTTLIRIQKIKKWTKFKLILLKKSSNIQNKHYNIEISF